METIGRIKLRKNDTVKVIAGREKGKTGRIIRIDREKMRAVVEVLDPIAPDGLDADALRDAARSAIGATLRAHRGQSPALEAQQQLTG